MALVRRHWKMMVLSLAVLVGGAAWLLLFHTSSQTTARAQVTTPPPESTADTTPARETLEEQTYYAVMKLRMQLMLRNEDLAALGCTGASSRAILEELLGLYEANHEQLQQARKTRLAAQHAYRNAMRRVNMGPRDESLIAQLPQLLSAIANTAKQERELTESAIPVIEQKLDTNQRSLWSSVRQQRHIPGLYRYIPDLSAQQRQSIPGSVQTTAYRRMTARTAEQKQLAETAATAEANVLSASQRTAMLEMRVTMQQNMPEILQASQNALPAPKLPPLPMPEPSPAMKEMLEKLMQEQQTP